MKESHSVHLPYAYVHEPLDRADEIRNDPAALREYWTRAKVIIMDKDGNTLVPQQNALPEIGYHTAHLPAALESKALFLGLKDTQAWFALSHADAGDVVHQSDLLNLRSAFEFLPAYLCTALAQARTALFWRMRHRYCGVCATALDYQRGGWLGICPSCGAENYPRTDPAVIMAVTDGERLLLGRQSQWPAGRYSTLAGFVEPAETPEQTLIREVYEESGVRVISSTYLAAQPWPFPSSLMLGYLALAHPDPPRTNDELEDARWFSVEDVGQALQNPASGPLLLSPAISISRWLIEQWYARITQKQH